MELHGNLVCIGSGVELSAEKARGENANTRDARRTRRAGRCSGKTGVTLTAPACALLNMAKKPVRASTPPLGWARLRLGKG